MTRAMAKKKRKAGRGTGTAPAAIQFSAGALRLAVAGLVVLFSLFAWGQRGMYEDGFFFLRVVDVFLHGGGLAYNPGERFETNTDFLWTLLLIPGIAAGVDDILWLQLIGVAIYAVALGATFSLARRMFPDSDAGLVALVLLGTHWSFAHFAATGFGPILQALATVCCLLALGRFGEKGDVRSGAALGFALLFLALCRLDSAVFGVPVVLCAMFFAWRGGRDSVAGLAVALAVPSVLFGGVLVWKLFYYGDVFPAPYYVKAADVYGGVDQAEWRMGRGALFAGLYWKSYFLWALAGAAGFGFWRILGATRKRDKRDGAGVRGPLLWAAGGMCVLWHAYMIRVGGGYAEFRLLMPQVPALALLLAGGLRGLGRVWRWGVVAAGAVAGFAGVNVDGDILVPGVYSKTGNVTETRLEWSGGGLRTVLFSDLPNPRYWLIVNRALGEIFASLGDYPPEVRIGSPDGGVSSYLTRLVRTETRGFADPRIGRAGAEDIWYYESETASPGHKTIARPRLLARLGVNLILPPYGLVRGEIDFDRPPRGGGGDARLAWAAEVSFSPAEADLELPADSRLVSMPVGGGVFLPVLYFNRNATIDRIFEERGISGVDVF